jgi:magnesium chelatase family protein
MRVCRQIDAEGAGYLEHAMEEMGFSGRAHDRILKVARTLADLGGSPEIRSNDVLEAIQFRSLDRKLFS